MTQETLTTPEQLEGFSRDRGWSYETLAAEISAAAGYRISYSSVFKFCTGRTVARRRVRHAIETFMAKQRETDAKARRKKAS